MTKAELWKGAGANQTALPDAGVCVLGSGGSGIYCEFSDGSVAVIWEGKIIDIYKSQASAVLDLRRQGYEHNPQN